MLRGCQFKLIGEKTCLLPFANSKVVDQPAILSMSNCNVLKDSCERYVVKPVVIKQALKGKAKCGCLTQVLA